MCAALRPLLPFREADALTFENTCARQARRAIPEGGIVVRGPIPELPRFGSRSQWRRACAEADPVWYRNIEYTTDIARGYDGHEDQFSPGILRDRSSGRRRVRRRIDRAAAADPAGLGARSEAAARRGRGSEGVRGALDADADDFCTATSQPGVIAGFPWFGEWGRDTCISLPGLTLARGKIDECGEALASAARFLDRGLMPNIFGADRASSNYNWSA